MEYRIAGRSLNVSMSKCFEIYCTVLYLLFIVLYIVVRSQATFHLFIKRDQNRVPYLALDFKALSGERYGGAEAGTGGR